MPNQGDEPTGDEPTGAAPLPAPAVDDLHARAMLGRIRAALTGADAGPVRVGRFEIVRTLGHGGMGVVYEARDPNLGRVVALKVLDASPEQRSRVLQEARALARVQHPAIVAVHEADAFGNQIYIAMELVEGVRLDHWIEHARPSAQAIVDVFRRAGDALAAAHAAGVVHGDFKPHNALVTEGGGVKVVDFGLARIDRKGSRTALGSRGGRETDGADAAAPGWTVVGAGTPGYMAPEQIQGVGADERSDQFSFCVALFEALSGRRPFFGATPAEIAERTCRGDFDRTALRALPARLRGVLRRGLAHLPDARHASMRALVDQLRPAARWPRVVAVGAPALAITAVVAWQLATPTADAPGSRAVPTTSEPRPIAAASGTPSTAEPAPPAPPPRETAVPLRTAEAVEPAPAPTAADPPRPRSGGSASLTAAASPAPRTGGASTAAVPTKPKAAELPAGPAVSRATTTPAPRTGGARVAAAPTPPGAPAPATPRSAGYIADPNSPGMLASVEVWNADKAEASGKPEACLRMLDRALAINPVPEGRHAGILRARCEMRLGRCEAGSRRLAEVEIAHGSSVAGARAEATRLGGVLCPAVTGTLDERLARLTVQARSKSVCPQESVLVAAEALLAERATMSAEQRRRLATSYHGLALCHARRLACDQAQRARSAYVQLTTNVSAAEGSAAAADWAAIECTQDARAAADKEEAERDARFRSWRPGMVGR